MTVYFNPIANAIGNGIYAAGETFLNLSPWTKAATLAVAITIPILYNYGENSPESRQKVHAWNMHDKQVDLIRVGNNLMYEVSNSEKISSGTIPIPPNRRVEDCIDNLRLLNPAFQANGAVNFTSKCSTAMDWTKTIDNDTWAVTLINSDRGSIKGSLHGHAMLIIEEVNAGQHFIKKAHLTAATNNGQPRVIIGFTQPDNIFHNGKSETWVKNRQQIQQVLDQINLESSNPSLVNFSMFSSDWDRLSSNADNCMTWASKKLELAGIQLPPSAIPWAPKFPREYVEEPNGLPYIADGMWKSFSFTTKTLGLLFPSPEASRINEILSNENKNKVIGNLQRFTDGFDSIQRRG